MTARPSSDAARIAWFDPALDPDTERRTVQLIEHLRPGVVERDRRGAAPLEEAELLRQSGLAAITVDDESPIFRSATHREGAVAARWQGALSIVRRLARVDLSAAALLGYNFMHLLRIEIAGPGDVFKAAVEKSRQRPTLWGGANNPSGPAAVMRRVDGGYRVRGRKSFATAAQIADQLVVGEQFTDPAGVAMRLTFVVDAKSPGIRHGDDWHGIGARRSASGSLHFDDVYIADAAVFSTAPADPAKRTLNESIGSLAFQIMFVNLLTGLAQGALETTMDYLHQRDGLAAKPYPSHVYEALGYGTASAQAAAALADRANAAFAALVAKMDAGTLSPADRGGAADVISQAKIVADRTAHAVSTQVFEASGARGATTETGLDRYWRDTRTFTLHDPVATKAQEVGAFALHGRHASPSANS